MIIYCNFFLHLYILHNCAINTCFLFLIIIYYNIYIAIYMCDALATVCIIVTSDLYLSIYHTYYISTVIVDDR